MESSAFIDVRDVLRGILRRWLSILLFTAACAFLAYWFVNSVKPVYTSSAMVLVANQETPYTRVGQDRNERINLTERDIASQVQVVQSRDLALRVIQDLKLNEVQEFDTLKSGIGTIGQLMISFGFKPDPSTMTEEQRVIDHYYDKLTVFEVPGSTVISVQFESRDPKLATAVANKVAEYYVAFSKQALNEPTGEARDWLASQIEDLRKKVVESETAVEKFKAEAGIFRGAQAKLSNEELSSLNSQIIVASAARSEAQAKASSIRELLRTTGTVDTSADVLSSPLIQRLREQQVQLTRSRAELSTIYLDNHPRIIAVNRELEDLNRQIRSEAFKVVERLDQEAKVAAARENALRANLDKLKAETSATGIDDVRLRELEREAAANRSLLESFLVRFTDANSRQDISAQPGLGRIISAAGEPSEPSFPKKGPIMLLATFGGFILAIGLAFVVEVMSSAANFNRRPDSVSSGRDAEVSELASVKQSGGAVPTVAAAATAAVAEPAVVMPSPMAQPSSVTSPAVHQSGAPEAATNSAGPLALTTLPGMATSMVAIHATSQALFEPQSQYRKALEPVFAGVRHLVASSNYRRVTIVNLTGQVLDGLSFTLAMGRLLAMSGLKAAILDVSSGQPGLAALEPELDGVGIYDLVANKAGFADIIRKDKRTQLQTISAGQAAAANQAMVSSPAMEQAIRALEQVYQVSLIHVGEGNEENVELAANSSVVLVLAAENRVNEANEICAALKSGKVKEAAVLCVQSGSAQAGGKSFQNIAASL
jgi:succinoglycan biosynthesis transport protein ExoP